MVEQFILKRKLVSITEAAQILGRSVPAVRSLVYAGHFETFRLGPRSKVWIPVSELDRFIAANTLQRTSRPATRPQRTHARGAAAR